MIELLIGIAFSLGTLGILMYGYRKQKEKEFRDITKHSKYEAWKFFSRQ